jgi:hypothetical protein
LIPADVLARLHGLAIGHHLEHVRGGRLLLVFLLAILSACTLFPSDWTLFVSNSHGLDRVVVRVQTADGPKDWLFEPSEDEVLLHRDTRVPGPMELLDPSTCEVLARTDLPRSGSPIAVISRGVTGEGPWEINMDASSPQGAPGIDPNFDGCVDR